MRAVLFGLVLLVSSAASADGRMKTITEGQTAKLASGLEVKWAYFSHKEYAEGGVEGIWGLVVRVGGEKQEIEVRGTELVAEVGVKGRAASIRALNDGLHITVEEITGKGGPMTEDQAIELVDAEARRQKVESSGRAYSVEAGILSGRLDGKGSAGIRFEVGLYSRKLLRFEATK